MLETDSTSLLIDPDLNKKTDSLFYAYGIFSAMQMVADQYVIQGEARGDLLDVTKVTDNNIRQMASYRATTANKYDSAYVYYRIINNCNYYLAKRDTTLTTGGNNVVIAEYAGVAAIRAWAYLQLVRNYKQVPLVTEPLTKISEINSTDFPMVDLNGLLTTIVPHLAKFSGIAVPQSSGRTDVGSSNFGEKKEVYANRCFIPVDVVLGDILMEAGEYKGAAMYFTKYILDNKLTTSPSVAKYDSKTKYFGHRGLYLPNDWNFSENNKGLTWSTTLNSKQADGIISYIPMAVNRLRGITSELPLVFGFNYYASNRSEVYTDGVQLTPSKALFAIADSCDFYYYSTKVDIPEQGKSAVRLGDQRIYSFMERGKLSSDTSLVWAGRYNSADIVLYRQSGIFLRLAECFNRMGHPDAAFAILKEGINDLLLRDFTVSDENKDAIYITPETREMLQTTCPFLSEDYIAVYTPETNGGIHHHGCGATEDRTYPGSSPYQYKTVVGKKMADIAKAMGVEVGTTKQDTINAVEDLICDEYALELTFDGNRYGDLLRMAKAKNRDALYGADFGTRWLMNKLSAKEGVERLADENNWYLPFK